MSVSLPARFSALTKKKHGIFSPRFDLCLCLTRWQARGETAVPLVRPNSPHHTSFWTRIKTILKWNRKHGQVWSFPSYVRQSIDQSWSVASQFCFCFLFFNYQQWKSAQTSCWEVNILHALYWWCHSFQAPVSWLSSSEGVAMNSLLIASCNLSRHALKCIIAESYETIWADAASLNN